MATLPQTAISHPVTGVAESSGTTEPSALLPLNPVSGSSDGGDAVFGQTNTGVGIRGAASSGTGVSGESNLQGIGVLGYSQGGPALLGQADATGVGLLALGSYDSNPPSGTIGSPLSTSGGVLPAAVANLISANKGFAAILSGKVSITDVLEGASAAFTGALNAASATFSGAVTASSAAFGMVTGSSATFSGAVTASDVVLTGADCAEEFDIDDAQLQPGSVVVFTDKGGVAGTTEPYDRRVAGVISGAGAYRPGVILDRKSAGGRRVPIALVGKVFCKVDADFGPIKVGDLLTTSPTVGCAMRAEDPARAFGSVIGKALAPHADGLGLIPMLVTLQ